MGIEYLQWECCITHDGNRIVNNGNITKHTMGTEYLQWEYCITHDGNRIIYNGNITKHNGNRIITMGI